MQVAFNTKSGIKRQDNQDYVGAFTNQSGIIMAMVADGVTSNEGGEVASAMAVEHFGHAWEQTKFDTLKPTIAWLKETAQLENEAILAAGQRFNDLNQMATTLIIAVLFKGRVILGNLGDSKAFLLHDNQLTQISFDHNLKNELLRTGTIGQEASEKLLHANSVTRFLGVDQHAEIEITQHDFIENDMLFLTSDGITKTLSQQTMKQILQQPITLEQRAKSLINIASESGATDDLTALLVGCGDEEESN